jgi:hypothetical protein
MVLLLLIRTARVVPFLPATTSLERTMTNRVWMAALAAAALVPSAAAAQDSVGPRSFVGLSFVAADPVGDLEAFFDQGFGAQLDGSWVMTADRRVRLRADLGFLVYGYERIRYCYTVPIGCRIEADLKTTNNIVYFGLGPELALAAGALEPYVYGTTGVSYFATISSFDDRGPDWAETTNYSDVVMAWRLGGGLRMRLDRGPRPVSLDFGVERHQNGIVSFLTEGDIVDNPDGSITLFPNRSDANLMTFRVGVSIGVGGGRGPR